MQALEFLLILIIGALLYVTVQDDLRLRTANGSLSVALTQAAGASNAETASASQGQLRCSQEARSAVNAGRAISRIAAPHPAGPRPIVSADDIRSVVQP